MSSYFGKAVGWLSGASCERKYDDLVKTNVLSDIYSVSKKEKRMIEWTFSARTNTYVLNIENRFLFSFNPNNRNTRIENRAGCGSFGCSIIGTIPNGSESLIPGVETFVIKLLANGTPDTNREEQVLEEINIQRLVYQCIPNATPFIYKKLFGEYTRNANMIKQITAHKGQTVSLYLNEQVNSSRNPYSRYSFYISEYYKNTDLYTIFLEQKDSDAFQRGAIKLLSDVYNMFKFMNDNQRENLNDKHIKIAFKHNDLHCGNLLYRTDEKGAIYDWRIIDFGVSTVSRVYNTDIISNTYNFEVPGDDFSNNGFKYKVENYINFLPKSDLPLRPGLYTAPTFGNFPPENYNIHKKEYSRYITDYIFSDYHVFYFTFIKHMIMAYKGRDKPEFYTYLLNGIRGKYNFFNDMSSSGNNMLYKNTIIRKMAGSELLYDQFKWLLYETKGGYLDHNNLFNEQWQPYLSIWRVVALFVEVYISHYVPELYKQIIQPPN
jgi:hypothetical protein